MDACNECYWECGPGKCEVHGVTRIHGCWDYLDDKRHSKNVREKLETDPKWCEENWNLLDSIDRQKFYRKYGKPIIRL